MAERFSLSMVEKPLRITIAPEVVEELQDWSAPLRLKIEEGELIARRADDPRTIGVSDDQRWPKALPPMPISRSEGES